MLKLILFLIACASTIPSQAAADLITDFDALGNFNATSDVVIGRIDWSMKHSEMVATLKADGMRCEEDTFPFSILCNSDRGTLRVLEDSVVFYCNFTSTCELEVTSIAQRLVDQYPIKEMNVEYDGGQVKICGQSDGQNFVCVESSTGRGGSIRLSPIAPSAGVKFN